ncbi:S8 family serine peptidase [Pseudoalteromonas sp. YIC-656]|uniref:S8 family serine peptidase n=1 Tax=Pseudoalteromonas pernae TaxID=3118054 RepID=UPI00324262D4
MKVTKIASAIAALSLGMATNLYAQDSRYVIQVDNANKGIVKALAAQMGADINVDGDGFIAATFEGKDLSEVKGLLNNPHIKLVELDQRRSAMALFNDDAGNPTNQQLTPYAVYQSQANQLMFNANSDIKVCVIDSGLDRSNSDFNWNAITGSDDPGTGAWDVNGGPHGTHVAGTIGAADNGYGVVGMAPGVPMHIVKVFTASGWAYSSDLAYATQQCAQGGANIINMSLGGGGANNTESNAFANFVADGGLIVAAAGNDGNSARSYPAGYPSVMMIGANDADNNIAEFSQFPSCSSGRGKRATFDETICVEATAGGVQTLSTYPAGMASLSALTVDGTAIPTSGMENTGNITANTYFMGTAEIPDSNAAGKICVIDRGNISFHDKVLNCENSGGVGAIIVNNVEGMLYGTLGDANATSIPAAGAALAQRDALVGSISASISIGASDYGYMSGTSMATPAVAGIAALVWSNFPECTGEEIRAALKATALDSGAQGHDVYFGYGIVQANDASNYLTANGCQGTTPPPTEPPTGEPTPPELTASHAMMKGKNVVELVAAASRDVNLYRNGTFIAKVAPNTVYGDKFNRNASGTFTYQACDSIDTSLCSEVITISF